MDEGQIPSVVEMTLFGAINELVDLSWVLDGLIFGTEPKDEPVTPNKPQATDKITEARDTIMSANSKLRVVIKKLKGMGS